MMQFYNCLFIKMTEVVEEIKPRRGWLLGAVASAAALAGAGWAWFKYTPQPPASGALDALWQLTMDTPEGGSLALATLKNKPLLVNFWATWCPPCVEELPLLDRFYRENKANGWQVVGIAVDQRDPVVRFLGKMPLQFPVVLAGLSGIDLGKALGNLSGGLPFSVVVTAGGIIAHRKMGRVTPEDLKAWALLR
jgi:thiol-disulfide isomerase/thioredoxin